MKKSILEIVAGTLGISIFYAVMFLGIYIAYPPQ